MAIKLIVTDMDGTLLNENIELSDRAAEAIVRAQNAGLDFAIATGRTVDSGYSIVKERGITCSFIELNGARMFDENEELQFTRAIDKDMTKSLIDIFGEFDLHNEFITHDNIYSNKDLEDYVKSFKAVFQSINKTLTDEEATRIVKDRLQTFNIQTIDDFRFLYEDPSVQVLKMLANATEDVSLLTDLKRKVEANIENVIVTSASTHNLEINHISANKGQAVSEYAAARGYKPSEVITIGDNINDLTMLEWADHSYAVANAHEQAKKTAKYLAPSHVDDAVAQIIDRVLNGKSLRF